MFAEVTKLAIVACRAMSFFIFTLSSRSTNFYFCL